MTETIYRASLLVYPVLFVIFMLLAILAVVDNVNRLKRWERIAFHALFAIFFLIVTLRTDIIGVIDLRTGHVITRFILIFLIFVTLPSTLRGLIALWCSEHDCEERESDGARGLPRILRK